MRKHSRQVFRLGISILATFGFIPLILAQSRPAEPGKNSSPTAAAEKSKIATATEPVAIMNITIDENPSIKATQRLGMPIQIEKEGEYKIKLIPFVSDSAGTIAVRVSGVIWVKRDNKVFEENLEDKTLDISNPTGRFFPSFTCNESTFTLEFLGTSRIDKRGDAPLPMSGIGGLNGECCISCNGVRTCACAVEASCGSCCYGYCC